MPITKKKQLLAKIDNSKEQEDRLKLLLSFPLPNPDKGKPTRTSVVIPNFEWVNKNRERA
jgi:cell shape-determining protein MreC